MGLYYILSSLTGRGRGWVRLLQLDAAEQCSHVGVVLRHVCLHAEGVLAITLLDDVFGLTLLGDIETLPCQRSGTTVSLRWYKNTTAPVQLYQRGGMIFGTDRCYRLCHRCTSLKVTLPSASLYVVW